MFGGTFWVAAAEEALPVTSDDMAPLFEPSRANERLLIELFSSFTTKWKYKLYIA
jgi:hypothetical protein